MELITINDEERAEALTAQLFAQFMRPPASLTVSEWADRNRVLSGKASSEPGPWRTDRTPYLRQIMDDLSARSSVQEVVVMFAAQLGKSESGMNWLGYIIDNEPGPVMVVQPTTEMAKRFSRQRIAPMLDETPALRAKVRENRSRDDANTTLLKDFAGGVLVVSGANSAASLRSMPVRYLFLDEIDAYPFDVDGEGDPVALAEKRTSTFARRKVLKVSTPTIKDFSRIEAAYLATNACRYFVPCPHCGEYQVLEWGAQTAHGLRWDKLPDGSPDLSSVHYVCAHCGAAIAEHHKPAMLAAGQWRASKEATRPGRMTGYQLNALYAPLGWIGWSDLVAQWHAATTAAKQGDVAPLKTFTNTVLAETWEEQGDKVASHDLARRAEDYQLGTVPNGGLLLTMGVDVQADRIEYRVWAWGRGQESWLVQREVIYGDPAIDEGMPGSVWSTLTERRRTPLLHASGAHLLISACAIDSGGHHTQQVYAYVRAHQHSNVLAVKGASNKGKSVLSKPTDVEVTWRGQKIQRGVKLWLVGTDIAKSVIYSRLRMSAPGPGYIHLPKALAGTDEFEQLTAERLVTKYIKGHARMEWVKPSGRRNEALDCAVYAYAAAVWAGIERFTEVQWQRLEDRVAPRVRDLFAASQDADKDHQIGAQQASPKTEVSKLTAFQRPSRRPTTPTRSW
ncbi:MAG: phage terminase large subunit family protein [Rhodocyclaceae bacterium]|nr:phage terminase large subunit family protein [Rhodocyclaceae bacterium]